MTNSPQGTPVKRVGGGGGGGSVEGRSSTVLRATQLRRMYTKLITRFGAHFVSRITVDSVSDPYSFHPDPAKNLNPDPEDPLIRILNTAWNKNIFYQYKMTKERFCTELGTRQFCRDNVTMLLGHKVVCNCHFTIFILATPSRH